MNIRRATAKDAPMLARVHVDTWQVAYRGIVPDSHLERFTYQRREEAFRQALNANLEETYLIEDNDQGIGILTIGASRDPDLDTHGTGEIWGIYITPAYWRRGVGTMLVQEAERILQARGYTDVVCACWRKIRTRGDFTKRWVFPWIVRTGWWSWASPSKRFATRRQ